MTTLTHKSESLVRTVRIAGVGVGGIVLRLVSLGISCSLSISTLRRDLVQCITSAFRALRLSIGLRPRIVYEYICGILYLEKVYHKDVFNLSRISQFLVSAQPSKNCGANPPAFWREDHGPQKYLSSLVYCYTSR